MKKKNLFWVLFVALALFGGWAYWAGPFQQQSQVQAQVDEPQPDAQAAEPLRGEAEPSEPQAIAAQAEGPQVDVTPAQAQELGIEVQAVGSLWARDAVMLRAETTGSVAEIQFQEGQAVEQGHVLLRLDDSLLRAQLQQAEANLTLKQSQYARAQQLSQEGFISAQARDEVASELAVARAQVALAQAQLDKTVIQAPFDGVLGFRYVSVGDYVAPGTDLVRIEAVDPLFVEFQIPEHYLPMVRTGTPVVLRFDAFKHEFFPGQVDVIDPAIDSQGRSLRLRARVPNPDGHLRPGLFARVQVQLERHEAVMVPEAAIAPSAGEQYIFVLQPDNTVKRQAVGIGIRRGGWVEVSGIQAGQDVLISGLQKVRDGMPVTPQQRALPFE